MEASRIANAQKKVTKAAAAQDAADAKDKEAQQDKPKGKDQEAKQDKPKGKPKPEADPEKWASMVPNINLAQFWFRICVAKLVCLR